MTRRARVAVDVHDLRLTDPRGQGRPLADGPGVRVVVLMRHRH
ncbi:hypothetical protein JOD57_002319 [Geodermatophilus bullaregiensis]|nr:hypothetical protein [Geodermatophilus bullaregiensis]MBM7806482.1 hypothetical protein [Geodermatophilus bullaregiensis]